MRNVKMHYEGWVQLPTGIRNKLALATNDELEITLTDGGVLLRPAGAKTTGNAIAETETASIPLSPAAEALAVTPAAGAMLARAGRGPALPPGLPRRRRKAAAPRS